MLPEIPSDQELADLAEKKPLGIGMIAAAALAGGAAIGSAIALSIEKGWIEEPHLIPDPTPGEEFFQWCMANIGIVLAGDAMRQIIIDMGRDKFLKTIFGYSAALVAFKLALDGVRKLREREAA